MTLALQALAEQAGRAEISSEEIKQVYKYSDVTEDEPKVFNISTSLWRKLISLIPQDKQTGKHKHKLIEVFKKMARLHPKFVHRLLDDVVTHPDRARENIMKMMADEKIETEED